MPDFPKKFYLEDDFAGDFYHFDNLDEANGRGQLVGVYELVAVKEAHISLRSVKAEKESE